MLLLKPASAHPDLNSAAAHPVHGGDDLGELARVAERHWTDHRAQPNRLHIARQYRELILAAFETRTDSGDARARIESFRGERTGAFLNFACLAILVAFKPTIATALGLPFGQAMLTVTLALASLSSLGMWHRFERLTRRFKNNSVKTIQAELTRRATPKA